jgi:hypothetical protein
MSQMLRGGKVNLNPRPFSLDSRADSVTKYIGGQPYHFIGQDRVFGRVLDRVLWQCAAVAD